MDKIDEILTRRVEKILPSKEGLKFLMQKKKIRLYQGFDPTGTQLHLGHSIGLRKLMEFANLGHEVIFVFGTGTVLVGDPSLRDTARSLITEEEIEKNIKDWKSQAAKIVDFKKVKIMKNGDWLRKLTLKEIVSIASKISAVQLFKRESFQRRIEKGDTIWYHETMYPLLQGYDSVVMDVDLEIGGTDQEFNMLIGRELQEKINSKQKYVLTLPMILGTDGKQMSKTSGNCVWLNDTPKDMFGKIMSIPDEQIVPYLELVTDIPIDQVREIEELHKLGKLNPLDAKKRLAHQVLSELHGVSKADKEQVEFENVFQNRQVPTEIETIKISQAKLPALELFSHPKLLPSRSEVKRLIGQRAIEVEGKVVSDHKAIIGLPKKGAIVKIGKRKIVKLIPE